MKSKPSCGTTIMITRRDWDFGYLRNKKTRPRPEAPPRPRQGSVAGPAVRGRGSGRRGSRADATVSGRRWPPELRCPPSRSGSGAAGGGGGARRGVGHHERSAVGTSPGPTPSGFGQSAAFRPPAARGRGRRGNGGGRLPAAARAGRRRPFPTPAAPPPGGPAAGRCGPPRPRLARRTARRGIPGAHIGIVLPTGYLVLSGNADGLRTVGSGGHCGCCPVTLGFRAW